MHIKKLKSFFVPPNFVKQPQPTNQASDSFIGKGVYLTSPALQLLHKWNWEHYCINAGALSFYQEHIHTLFTRLIILQTNYINT